MYLLDTNIISNSSKHSPDHQVEEWIKSKHSSEIFLSSITIGELYRGIHLLTNNNKQLFLLDWLSNVEKNFSSNILAFDNSVAEIWGKLAADFKRFDLDLMIAATAVKYGLIMVTRNVKHFKVKGLKVYNPFTLD